VHDQKRGDYQRLPFDQTTDRKETAKESDPFPLQRPEGKNHGGREEGVEITEGHAVQKK